MTGRKGLDDPCRPTTDPTIAQTPCSLGILPLFWARVPVNAMLDLLGVIALSNNPYVAGCGRSRIVTYFIAGDVKHGFSEVPCMSCPPPPDTDTTSLVS